MKRTGKMILSAVFGALIGLIIAFAVDRLYWWVGMLAGGVVGYLSYEWRVVLRAAIELITSREKLAVIGRKMAAITTVLCWAGGWGAVAAYPIIFVDCGPPRGPFAVLLAGIGVVWAISVAALSVVFLLAAIVGDDFESDGDSQKELKFIFFSSSLVAIFVMLPYMLYLFVKELPKIGKEFGRFVWKLLLLIHSDDRMIVGFSALLGTAGGYVAKSFIIGATVAAASVVFARYVVADRWLKAKGYLPLH